ncbi:MAG: ribokinase [Pseudomonadota bacterium]
MNASIINFGSINIDHVYQVPHMVNPGETLASLALSSGLGGKGANQSVALARAGAAVSHIGRLSTSDDWAIDILQKAGVDTSQIEMVDEVSGHAIIQLDEHGENAIVLHGGANQSFDLTTLRTALEANPTAEYLLMQNECNLIAEAFALAEENKLKIAFNPAPMTEDIKQLPLARLDTLIVNQGEAEALCGKTALDDMIQELQHMLPDTRTVITLGGDGAVLVSGGEVFRLAAPKVEVVDTTGAGDTFVGYFIAGLLDGMDERASLELACKAGANAVTRLGAISAIPERSEL